MKDSIFLEKYIEEIAKILRDAKTTTEYWGLTGENGLIKVDPNSDSKEILQVLGVFTSTEFEQLTAGYEGLEIRDLPRLHIGEHQEEKDGIYIEKCRPTDSIVYGRKYSIIQGSKKISIVLNTKDEKHISICMIERTDEGLYIYTSGTDEIRLIPNDESKELGYLGLLHSTRLVHLDKNGTLIANNVFKGQLDEKRINYLFTMGIKGYVDEYSPKITHEYEDELSEIAKWTR